MGTANGRYRSGLYTKEVTSLRREAGALLKGWARVAGS